jgi:magnesium chelatase subunit D
MQQKPLAPLPSLDPKNLQHLKVAVQYPPLIEITSEACELIIAYQEGEVFHQRRELALARCALTLAQLSGDTQLLVSHVEHAAKIMGLQQQTIHDDSNPPPDIEAPELPTPSIEGNNRPPTPGSPGPASTEAQPDVSEKNIEVQMPERSEQEAIDYVMAAANPYPEDTEPILREAASLQIPQQHFMGTRPDRGPIIGVEPSTTLRDLSLVSTLMRALLFQAFRAKHNADEIVLDWTDLRKYRRAAEPEQLLLLLLDYTSLPLAQRQQALVPYIAQAYIDRASITIVKVGASASGTKHHLRAETVSARSILVPAISEAIDAPTGNTTPLAHGLELALQVIQRALQHGRSTVQHITFVVVSDGRGNVPLQASHRNTITPPIAREGVNDALAQALEIGKIKHVSSVVLSPTLRYYQELPQRLATALHAQLVCVDDKEGKQ